jgi:ABC-type sugar transport system permease subunit
MFPLNISALILMAFKFHEFFRIIIILGCVWSTFSASGFLKSIIDEDDIRGLVLYPVILLYLFLSGVILMNRF